MSTSKRVKTAPAIYLCGPITGQSFKEAAEGWRKDVAFQLEPDITCLNPLRHLRVDQVSKDDRAEMSPMGAQAGVLSTPRGLTERDRFDTMRSDMIFCNFLGATKISAGSMIEFGWADIGRVPLLLCMEEEGNPNDHAMVRAIASWIVHDIDEAIQVTKDLLL